MGMWVEKRRNRLVNPNFGASSFTGWGLYFVPTRTIDLTNPYPGGNGISCLVSRAADARAGLGVNSQISGLVGVSGQRHAIFRVKGAVGTQLNIGFRTGLGFAAGGATVAGDGTWHEYEYFTTDTAANGVQINVTNSDTLIDGNPMFWLDSCLFELNTKGGYLDGATADTSLRQYDWVASANNSESTESIFVDSGQASGGVESSYLAKLGAASGPLSDMRRQIYGSDPFAYFSGLSGLSPAGTYSLNDHKRAYYRNQLGLTTAPEQSVADLARSFWFSVLGV